ncbi:hypothetical protein [Lachnoclostridium sp. An138]|uniref:hypothetical protein n=1 Tax=Lachnoclostridium sp. An138 TaxID=1965560 RepID=UPI0013A6263E|nr:hypothetical protein [Lachnoclostridium sp. An138]
MTEKEYRSIQSSMDHLIENLKFKNFTEREQHAYKSGILACKSAVSKCNPERRDENEK